VVKDVRAAGGIVWRVPEGGTLEVLIVHRPRYDDWTLPKGKAEPGETDEQTALREVEEETGFRCHLGREVARSLYTDHKGRAKTVRYWEMTVADGAFVSNDEVDGHLWVGVPEARARMTYPRDRDVLDAFAVFAGET
jgi:8-oxo-dGTP diphosphatase